MACAALGTPLVINETSVQISYVQATEGQRDDAILEQHSKPPSATRVPANVFPNTARTIHKWKEVADTGSAAHELSTSKTVAMPAISHTTDTEPAAEYTVTGAQVQHKYPSNLTCWFYMLRSAWEEYEAIVSLETRSPCVPGNHVILRGLTFRYPEQTERRPENVTWTGCEGPQDPLGDFKGHAVYVGFSVSRLDVEYHVTVGITADHKTQIPNIDKELNVHVLTRAVGGYFCFWQLFLIDET